MNFSCDASTDILANASQPDKTPSQQISFSSCSNELELKPDAFMDKALKLLVNPPHISHAASLI